jgi:hypothetical protein
MVRQTYGPNFPEGAVKTRKRQAERTVKRKKKRLDDFRPRYVRRADSEWKIVEEFSKRTGRPLGLYTVERMNRRSPISIKKLLPDGYGEVEPVRGHHPWINRDEVNKLHRKARTPYYREMTSREARAVLLHWAIMSGLIPEETIRGLLEIEQKLKKEIYGQ